MNFNLKTALGSIAPTLATMLDGPLAGTAVTALEGALGLAPSSGQDAVTSAVAAGMTPDALAAVRAADQKHLEILGQQGIDLQKMNDDFAQAMNASAAADRASARAMQTTTRAWTVPALAWLVVVAFGVVTAIKLLGVAPVGDQTTGDLITTLRDALLLVLSFYFGSSAGSAKKDDTIQAQAKAASN